ncbi:hypothetical protein V8C34DRAFT_318266 [Trichoderma compactum]
MASIPFFVLCTPRMLIGAHRFSLAMRAGSTGPSSPGNRPASWSRLTGQFIHETACASSDWSYGHSGRGTGGNCLISFAAAEGVGNEDIGYKSYPSAIGETRHLDHSALCLAAHAAGADRGFGEGGMSFRVTLTATKWATAGKPHAIYGVH